MKKTAQILIAALVFVLAFSFAAHAKDLEPCYHCKATGKFVCAVCGNMGGVTCGGCGGTGEWHCPGEDGRGTCDGGYYVCPSCHGDTYMRSGEGEIPPDAAPGSCGTCSGKGKLECWTCHGKPTRACDACGGTGKEECQETDCKKAKAVGWKCPYCMGAGYLLTNFWPGENDGVQNQPVRGDKIWENGKSKTYTGPAPSSGGSAPSSGSSAPSSGGSAPSSDPVPADDPTPVDGDPTPVDGDPTPVDGPDLSILPEDRSVDFDVAPNRDFASAFLRVEPSAMSEAEKQAYDALSDEALARLLEDARDAVCTGEAGRASREVDRLFKELVAKNGFDSVEDGRLYPLSFQGEREIGFPVRVTVSVPQGALAGGTDLFVYRLAEDGTIEPLGKADYFTHEDGTVAGLTFYTASISTFFTAAKELALDLAVPVAVPGDDSAEGAALPEDETVSKPEKPANALPIVIGGAAVVLAAAAAVFAVRRRKRR